MSKILYLFLVLSVILPYDNSLIPYRTHTHTHTYIGVELITMNEGILRGREDLILITSTIILMNLNTLESFNLSLLPFIRDTRV